MSIVSYKNLKKYMKDMLPDDKVKLRLIGSMGVGTGRNFFGEDILDVGVNGLCSGNLTDDSDIDLKDAVECVFTFNHEIAHYNQQHDSDVKSNVIESYLSQLGNQAFYFAWNDGIRKIACVMDKVYPEYKQKFASGDSVIFDEQDLFGKNLPNVPFNYKISVVTRDLKSRLRDRLYKNANKKSLKIESEVQKDVN